MQRDTQIDIAKGLGIYLVVLGHLVPITEKHLIFIFHMPFFFMISGYLFKPSKDYKDFILKKSLSLLVPYFSYLLLINILPHIPSLAGRPKDPNISFFLFHTKTVVLFLYGGLHLRSVEGVFWFISCLFITQQLYNYVFNKYGKRITFTFSILLYLFGILNVSTYRFVNFPWCAEAVCMSMGFFALGDIYGNRLIKNSSLPLIISSFFYSVLIIYLQSFYGIKFNIDMKYSNYGVILLSPLGAIAISIILFSVARQLIKFKLATRLLSNLGLSSITILFTHQIFHYYMTHSSNSMPWLMSVVITGLCFGTHSLLSKSSFLRAFFLGSRRDLKNIYTKFSNSKE